MTILSKQYIDDHCNNLGTLRHQLTEFVVPDGITVIDTGAFEDCTSLTSITIPDSVIEIGRHVFKGCTSLRSIIIPDSVSWIDESAFRSCTSLESITIPKGVSFISYNAFWGCTSLTSNIIHDGVNTIVGGSFEGCTSLTSITIPYSVNTIQKGAFYGCNASTQIICNNPDLFTNKNILYISQKQFIPTTDYFEENYQALLNAIKPSGFNLNHVSSKELNLIIKLHQEDCHPNWKTITTTFKERSMDQIRAILHYFGKTQSMPEFFDTVSLDANNDKPVKINHLSMFLNPIEYTNLLMTAEKVTLISQECEELGQEHESASCCSIQ